MIVKKITDVKVGDNISMKLYGNTENTVITNGVVIGNTAYMGLRDINKAITMNSNIYPAIPNKESSNLTSDFKKYIYLVIKLSDDVVIEIAQCWIDPSSVVITKQTKTYITIENLSPEDETNIKTVFGQLGITNYTLWKE